MQEFYQVVLYINIEIYGGDFFMKEKRILIVDDEQGIVFLLEELLVSAGYETITARTGRKAIQIAEEEYLDLIILDFQLPMKNGLEVISEIQSQGITTPIIMMTGMSEEIEVLLKDIDQVKGLLKKPFDITEVITLVEQNLKLDKIQV